MNIYIRIIYLLIITMIVSGAVFAETSIDGLQKDVQTPYSLRLELSDNNTNTYLISIHPVNNLSLSYSNYNTKKPEIKLRTKLSSEEYQSIYEMAYGSISNFKVLDKPHNIMDATHFELTLNVNRREFSIKYFSISHIRNVSEDMHLILEIVNKYLPKDSKLQY